MIDVRLNNKINNASLDVIKKVMDAKQGAERVFPVTFFNDETQPLNSHEETLVVTPVGKKLHQCKASIRTGEDTTGAVTVTADPQNNCWKISLPVSLDTGSDGPVTINIDFGDAESLEF
ncbi:MAG: hypothetical protein GY765_36100 [bacterium]|nr:hypothetical protein [bacterium]